MELNKTLLDLKKGLKAFYLIPKELYLSLIELFINLLQPLITLILCII